MNPTPTSNDKEAKVESWLVDMRKPQLYNLIKKNKNVFKRHVIDEMFEKINHGALRLPPYHPDFNPIEMTWTAIKVAAKNVN